MKLSSQDEFIEQMADFLDLYERKTGVHGKPTYMYVPSSEFQPFSNTGRL